MILVTFLTRLSEGASKGDGRGKVKSTPTARTQN